MADTVGLLSLGCAKNRVDAELMLACLREAGFRIVSDASFADAVIVNTCGFIDDAKRESIDEILELISLKEIGRIRAIIVTGCLAERYQNEVVKEFPEINAVIGIGANAMIAKVVADALAGKKTAIFPAKTEMPLDGKRVRTTPKHYAYLKVADGCDNCCTYCAIPLIRGGFRSRRIEEILKEAKTLALNGVKELLVIAQDTTRYGEDLYGKLMLPELLRELCKIEGIEWIRILYCYPDRITDELLNVIASEEKILNYIDLPLQHCNGKILKAMNRRGDRETLKVLIEKIRGKIPDVILRTTFICGFPGETEEEFEELCEFIKDIKFERMGCFTYSCEENTKAAGLTNQIEESVKQKRQAVIMEEQLGLMERYNHNMIGKTVLVLIDEYDNEEEFFIGRTKADAPDVDGRILVRSAGKEVAVGQFVYVLIKEYSNYDFIGELADS